MTEEIKYQPGDYHSNSGCTIVRVKSSNANMVSGQIFDFDPDTDSYKEGETFLYNHQTITEILEDSEDFENAELFDGNLALDNTEVIFTPDPQFDLGDIELELEEKED